jgi:hypothetical protein
VASRRSCSSSGSSRPVLEFCVLNKGVHILRNSRNYSPTTKHKSPEDLTVFFIWTNLIFLLDCASRANNSRIIVSLRRFEVWSYQYFVTLRCADWHLGTQKVDISPAALQEPLQSHSFKFNLKKRIASVYILWYPFERNVPASFCAWMNMMRNSI